MKPMKHAFGAQPGPKEIPVASLYAYAAGIGPTGERGDTFMLGVTAWASPQQRTQTFVFHFSRDELLLLRSAIDETLRETAGDEH